jgi:mono/diheme cytochrome c family protein
MIRKLTAFVTGIVVGVFALSAAAPKAHTAVRQSGLPATDQITNAMIKSGRDVFHGNGNCFVCHGQDLEGTPIAPTLQDHKWKDAQEGSLQEIYRVVTHGVEGTAMVSHPGGITDAQAVSAAVYVWSVSHGKTKP